MGTRSRFVRPSQERRGDTLESDSEMQSKNSTTQLELFNQSTLPETVTLHIDRPGFFSLLVRPVATTPRQSSYRVDLLPQASIQLKQKRRPLAEAVASGIRIPNNASFLARGSAPWRLIRRARHEKRA